MDEKLYKLVMIRRFTPMYFDRSTEEREQFHYQVEQIRADVGAKLASAVYKSYWSNEQVSQFYIVEYPNAGAIFEEMECLEKINFPWYVHATYLLGKPTPWVDLPFTPRAPVSKLVILSDDDEGYNRLPEEEKKRIWNGVLAAVQQAGASTEPNWYNCLATSGLYNGFGIMQYPDVQAIVKELEITENSGLLRYFHSHIIVGVRAES